MDVYNSNSRNIEIGNRLLELRNKHRPNGKRTSQEAFAKYLGIESKTGNSTQGIMSALESGKRELNLSQLLAYSQKCGVSTDWILTGHESTQNIPFIHPNSETLSTRDACKMLAKLDRFFHFTFSIETKKVEEIFTPDELKHYFYRTINPKPLIPQVSFTLPSKFIKVYLYTDVARDQKCMYRYDANLYINDFLSKYAKMRDIPELTDDMRQRLLESYLSSVGMEVMPLKAPDVAIIYP
ncbi:MAG: helix-turn-helix domain-containing protein [Stomatobaculum sp.]